MKGCTPENVDGALVGLAEANNQTPPFNEIDDLTPSGTARAVEIMDRGKAEMLDAAPMASMGIVEKIRHWDGDVLNMAKGVINDTRNPSGLLGEEFIQPMHRFLVEHLEEFGDEVLSPEARRVYFDQIDDILESLPMGTLDDTQGLAAERYMQFYRDGGEFYGKQPRGAIGQAMSDLTSNVLQNSPTVILGNVFEGTIKLPTLYPGSTFQGILKTLEATGGNIWARIPELEAQGVYGSSLGLEKGVFGSRLGGGVLKDGLIGLTDNPLKNITYFAGELADGPGGGLRAVQRVVFVPRLGDLPFAYHNGGERLAIQFLGYTVNTYKLYGQMWKDLGNPATRAQAAQQLLTFHALSAIIAGTGAAIPQPAVELIKAALPETEEFFDENRTPLAGLVQPGSIDRIFITGSIASRQFGKVGDSVMNTAEAFGQGDANRTVIEAVDTVLNLMPFTPSPLGDAQVQKIKNMAKDVALDELDIEDVPEEAAEKLLPFMNR